MGAACANLSPLCTSRLLMKKMCSEASFEVSAESRMLSNVVWSCRLTVNEDVFLDDLQCPIAIMQCLPCTCFIFYTTSRLLMQLAHGRDFRKPFLRLA